ncbi:HpcH/HpaI aldolase family protein [Paenibacillus thalictri]|uniref:Aldolase n=1 Tax=Paenibacillus thalictri TaxID=2527873 RepID=A0A4Q9DQV7_9BACL|nr:aldolase/citrate lyase family protein [Paenibacillus thalictri]TBL78984.1 aldolase [Paenibacillus thalictri]
MDGKSLKQALRSGQTVYGTLVVSTFPKWPQEMRSLGLDFVFIDTEHIAIDRLELSWMCQTFRSMDIAPVVRIPAPDPYMATMALDGGAAGIVAPYVETVEQVQALRGAVKLRPLKGEKLQRVLDGRAPMEDELRSYVEERNADNVLIVNIESGPAIEQLDKIVRVPDLDGVLIGPHDLSCSLGVPEQYRHPVFDRAVRTILGKARAAGIGAGLHYWAGMDQQIAWAKDAGMNMIVHKADIISFIEQMGKEIGELKAALGGSSDRNVNDITI